MAYLILDADGYQNVVDFDTGNNLDTWDDRRVDDMLNITPPLVYPGDLNFDSIEWTTRVAQSLCDYYQPDFLFVNFAIPTFIKSTQNLSTQQTGDINRRIFDAITDFLAHSDYSPVIIGSGGMTPIIENILPPEFNGSLSFHGEVFPYAGIFEASADDLKLCREIPHTSFIPRERFLADFPEMSEAYYKRLPDAMLICDNGYPFSSGGNRGMRHYMTQRAVDVLPIHTTLPLPGHVIEVRKTIDTALDAGQKVALFLLEGTGAEDFRLPFQSLPCTDKWFTYSQNMMLYSALMKGKKFFEYELLPVFLPRHMQSHTENNPYTHFFEEMPRDVIGVRQDKRTAAVGSRSIFTHAFSMADIAIECQSRHLTASGLLVLINDPK